LKLEAQLRLRAAEVDFVDPIALAVFVDCTRVSSNFFSPDSTFTGVVNDFELFDSVKMAFAPSTFNLYCPGFNCTLPTFVGFDRTMS